MTAQNNELKIKLELTASEVEYILDQLAQRPWREVNGLINKILKQYYEQVQQQTPQEKKES